MHNFKKTTALLLVCVMALSLIPFTLARAENYNPDYLTASTIYAIQNNSGAVIDSDGSLWMWGNNKVDRPQYVTDNVAMISVPEYDSSGGGDNDRFALLKKDGRLLMKGENQYGTIGNGTTEDTGDFVHVMDDVIYVHTGGFNTAAIKTDGSLWMWGWDFGHIGSHTTSVYGRNVQTSPVKIMDNVKKVTFYKKSIYVLKTDNTLWLATEPMGSVTKTGEAMYRQIFDNVINIYCRGLTLYALRNDHKLYAFNYNYSDKDEVIRFQPGDGKTPIAWTLQLTDVKDVSFTGHTLWLKTNNTLWAKGSNTSGQIGNGTRGDKTESFVKVLDNVVCMSAGIGYSLAITDNGGVWVWGNNTSNQLANGGVYNDYKVYEKPDIPPGQLVLYKEGTDYFQTVPYQWKNFEASLPVSTAPKCKVNFDLDGGTGTTETKCDIGCPLTPPDNPSKDGYYFAGWYKDRECKTPWNFDTDTCSGNCTIYAKWLPKSTSTVIAEPSVQVTEIDGKEIIFNTYILRDKQGFDVNFVKLRDVAYVLNGTEAQFNVDWKNNAIRLDPKKPYTTPNGAELTVPSVISAPAKTSITPVLTNGVTAPLEAFLLIDQNDGGHNYFKLRDIGKVAGFNVKWDDKRQCIVITTTEDYSE